MAKAAHKDAYKQLSARGDHGMLAVVTLKDPASGKMRGFIPRTQLFGATAVVPRGLQQQRQSGGCRSLAWDTSTILK